jgi:hypothetical protein
MPRIRTFLDAGVLIAAHRGRPHVREPALAILEDPARLFLTSPFVALEILPKAIFEKQQIELAFYQRYLVSARWHRRLKSIHDLAQEEASRCGLAAMDALHVAAAHLARADELVTTEKPNKPIFRTKLVNVRFLGE